MTYTATANSAVTNGGHTEGTSVSGGLSTAEQPSKKPFQPDPTTGQPPTRPVATLDDNIEVSSAGTGQESAGDLDRAACQPEIGQLVNDPTTAWHDLTAIAPEFAPMRLTQSDLRLGLLLDPGAEAYGGDPEGWGVFGKIGGAIADAAGSVWDFLDDVPGVLHSAAKKAAKKGLKVVQKHGLTMVKMAAGKLVPLALQAIGGPGAVAAYQALSKAGKEIYNEYQKRNDNKGKKVSKAKMEAVLDHLDKMEIGAESAVDMESMIATLDQVAEAAESAEAIIGDDDRVQITQTEAEPWRRICALRIRFPTGATYRGTGFFIGPRSVATAGHCVYLESQGGWADTVDVIPGADGDESPFGEVTATDMRSVTGWVRDGKPESDYGCIVLPEGSFGHADLGTFGYGAFPANELVGAGAVVSGYPGDKPFGEAWSAGRAISSVSEQVLRYDIDTFGGQSGAPVYVMRNGSRFVVGIHNYGGRTTNSATRITAARYRRLDSWANIA